MTSSAATKETSIPVALKAWITDLCNGRAAVSVGHRMFAVDENIDNITLEQLLYLIRTSGAVVEYVGEDESRRDLVASYVAGCVSQFVQSRFKTARYPGD